MQTVQHHDHGASADQDEAYVVLIEKDWLCDNTVDKELEVVTVEASTIDTDCLLTRKLVTIGDFDTIGGDLTNSARSKRRV